MSRQTNRCGMDRRCFLASATAAALAASRAGAKPIEAGGDARKHRITSAEWFVYDTGRLRPNYWRPEQKDRVYGLALRLKTDAGAEGAWVEEVRIVEVKPGQGQLPSLQYASVREGIEAILPLDIADAQQRVQALVVGQSPSGIEAHWDRLHRNGVPLEIVTMVDLALWDLCGRIAEKPVYRLIGQKREHVQAYISSMPNLPNPAAWATHAVACKNRGYGGYKIHPYIRFDPVRQQAIDEYRGFPEQDIAVARTVREAVGPDFPLMFDAAWCYTYPQAVQVGHVLDELRFGWFESPMPENDAHLESYARLAKELRTPLCAPQADDKAHLGRRRWIERGACQVCRADVYAPGGGITSCLILADACQQAGIQMDLHAWGAAIYNLQALAAIPASICPYQEFADANPAGSLPNAGKPIDRKMAAFS